MWDVLRAFAPMSRMMESWRFMALRLKAMPSMPRSEWRSMPLSAWSAYIKK